jgi:hypothetical protein
LVLGILRYLIIMRVDKLKIIKWLSVVITIIAALTISLRVIDVLFSYYIFLIGHLIMTYVLFKFKDWSLFFMNMVWVVIDIVGIIKWY